MVFTETWKQLKETNENRSKTQTEFCKRIDRADQTKFYSVKFLRLEYNVFLGARARGKNPSKEMDKECKAGIVC